MVSPLISRHYIPHIDASVVLPFYTIRPKQLRQANKLPLLIQRYVTCSFKPDANPQLERESESMAYQSSNPPKLSAAQMNSLISQGYAQVCVSNDGNGDDQFVTRQHVYMWVPPARGHIDGHYKAIQSKN